MIDSRISLFGEPEPDGESSEPASLVESVAEVFELAREILGSEAGAPETLPPALARARARREAKAEELGLVARWGDYRKAKGHVSIHDPTSGGWHDLPWKDAPGWAQQEAVQRSSLYRSSGDAEVFNLNAAQIEAIWEEEHPTGAKLVEEGIVEEHELPDD
jgi:hypothetical protein